LKKKRSFSHSDFNKQRYTSHKYIAFFELNLLTQCKVCFTIHVKHALQGGVVKNFVKMYRENGKLTQEALANQLNVSRQTIISIESGKYIASLELALKLAEFFQTPVENLFSLKEEHEN